LLEFYRLSYLQESINMTRENKDYYALAAAREAERKKHLPQTEQATCLSCGAKHVGGVLGCRDTYHAITMRHPLPLTHGLGRAMFDTYCLQHLETLCYSAKSYAAHLAFVACWVDHGNPLNLLERARVGLNGRLDFERAPEPPSRGDLTILHLQNPSNQADYERRALEWTRDVWQAFAPLHEQARTYLRLFLG
jgi:Family of unknown function (DUF5946)